MDSLELLTAKTNPLGGEINITWEYPDELPSNYKVYLFKKSISAKDVEEAGELNPDLVIPDKVIYDYIKNPVKDNLPQGYVVFYGIKPEQREVIDYKVTETVWYVYKAIILDLTESDVYSQIVETHVQCTEFTTELFVIDTKQFVIDGMEKLVSALGKVIGAKGTVYRDFAEVPTKPTENWWLVVTRSSGEVAYRNWSNIVYNDGDKIARGDIDLDTIQVIWEVKRNSKLRDKLTDFFRANKGYLYRYLKMQAEDGIKDITMSLIGDGEDDKYSEKVTYNGMIISFLIENIMRNHNTTLDKAINLELGFNVRSDD